MIPKKYTIEQLILKMKANYSDRAYIYSNNSLEAYDLEYLSVVKQLVMMTRKRSRC